MPKYAEVFQIMLLKRQVSLQAALTLCLNCVVFSQNEEVAQTHLEVNAAQSDEKGAR